VIARDALVLLALAACNDPARVRLVPVPNGCDSPPRSRIKITSFAPSGAVFDTITGDTAVAISDLPADTEQLGVEVFGGDPEAVTSQGKTAPFAAGALGDGETIPVFMAPPNGACSVGDLNVARQAPQAARAGDGVVVVGGDAGQATAEYYDPLIATWAGVHVPSLLIDDAEGLGGMVLTTLADGRAMLSGGARGFYSVFDPQTLAFSEPVPIDQRAFAAAIAIDATHFLISGGCHSVAMQACDPPQLFSTRVYELDSADQPRVDPEVGPTMAANAIGAQLFDLGIGADGQRALVMAGGSGSAGEGNRLVLVDPLPDSPPAKALGGLHAQHAALDGGAVLSAFDPDGASPTGGAALVVPSGDVVPLAAAPSVDQMRLVALEDGSVLAVGPQTYRYLPTTDTWQEVLVGTPPFTMPAISVPAPTLVRMADGAVMILGGAAPSTAVQIFRPSLVGPSFGTLNAAPTGSSDGVLTVPDPRTVSRASGFTLTASDDAFTARVLVGGPRMAHGTVLARISIETGGASLIARQLGPGQMIVGQLRPGEPARIDRVDGADVTTICSGTSVPATLSGVQTASLTINGDTASLTLNNVTLVPVGDATCSLRGDPHLADRGAWGIAPAPMGAQLDVMAITLTR
jgi:hypothetical protein